MADLFQYSTYLVRRKIFKIFGGAFHIYGPDKQLVFYSKMKAFKLKEDIRLYTGTDMQSEVFSVKARQIIDFSATYDVVDSAAGQKIGALKRKGFKSMLRDEWAIMDASDREIGAIVEDSLLLAIIRRFLSNLIPQTYHVTMNGALVCAIKQNFNPFVLKMTVDFTPDIQHVLDKRLGLAGAILLCAIEGRQR
ncbi:MAG: hypothetical protein ACM3WV_03145 [Bacillota bacterium]